MPNYTLETQRGRRLTIESDSPENAMRLADQWDLEDHAASEAQKAGVNPDLVLRQMQRESGGNPNAVSPKGAGGPMQLMPGTARELGVDASDPYQNISGGVRYLKQQMDAFGGDETKALAAYNAGPGAVRKYGGVPPYAETQAYVKALAGKPPVPTITAEVVGRPEYGVGASYKKPPPAAVPDPAVTPKPVSQSLGFDRGFGDPVDRFAGFVDSSLQRFGVPMDAINRGLGQPTTAEVNARHQAELAAREATATPGKTGHFLGNVTAAIPVPGGPMVNGMLSGALLSEGQNPAEVIRDAAFGLVGGKLGASVIGGAGNFIKGVTGDALKLANKGVPLTLGQMAGGPLRKIEDSLTSVPVVGDMIRNAQRRGLEGVNRAAYDDTLAHLGEKLPDEINIGRDAYNYTKQRLSDAYDDVLAPLVVVKDAPWTAAVGAAKSATGKIGDKTIKANVNDIIKTEVLSRFDKAGQMVGEDMKAAQEALTGHIADLSKGTKWSRDAAGVLKGLKSDLEGLVTRVDAEAGKQLAKVNKAYSFLKPLETAAAKPSSKDGIFTMPQLSMAAAAGKSKATLAAGKAPHQELADAARILPSTVPDSGSAGRLFTGAGATGLMGLLGGHLPVIGPAALPAAGLIGGTALAYTRRGQEALTKLLTRRPEVARVVGKQVRRLAAPAGTVGAVATVTGARS